LSDASDVGAITQTLQMYDKSRAQNMLQPPTAPSEGRNK